MDIKEVILNNDIKNEKSIDIVKEEGKEEVNEKLEMLNKDEINENKKLEVLNKDEKINEKSEILNKDEINENEGIKDEITNNETINNDTSTEEKIIIEEQQYPNAIYFPTLSYHVLDILTKYMTIIQYYY